MYIFRSFLGLFSILLLSACARDANLYGCCFGQNIVGNKNYVTISNVWNEMDALPLAEEHCSGHSRSAKFLKMEGYRAIFECVE